MNILITGANGFLGKSIYKELCNENDIITISRENADINADLSKMIPVFFKKIDLVVHCAGKAHMIPKNAEEKKAFFDVNVEGTLNLLRGLENNVELPKYLVLISSVAVYGLEYGLKIDENYPLAAIDPYGISKIEAEKIIIDWCAKNNVIGTILRLPLLVGENPPGNLGAMLKAIEKGYYFNIGGGLARKSMVLKRDVASFIMKASFVGGIYNLTDGFHPSFSELSEAICKIKNKKTPLSLPSCLANFIGKLGDSLGRKSPINSLKLKKITSDLTFDDSKARKVLNWQPQSVINYLKDNNI
ncbi:UDP-glucose 4-epimerase [Flavobacterium anhuiense]|uniref:UDP-glucose 4-epimerase n=1 Tax=Flavobacterium anhuiense TaxID=459526 RepID=A0AAC9CZU2_9FLAO|nr:NAD-dependent epimerase/dehydratase family protein [Flavobacterium anhuiense]AOC95296.1 UDP-glucose 4-epimerase [Flavobacterium anhuiense]